ncbi:MAG: metabolite traffic protein EboE, partial [Gammaproteobacteria bacterium]|nr:metabolite traffic protein EboE [Gammaproteobacteria bacterium]
CDLTYCTNIHPGETWQEVRLALGYYLPQIKSQISPNTSFGVGLRLSEYAARELEIPGVFAEFSDFLHSNGLYVFTLNGFPFGAFHHQSVKDKVYLPDWTDIRRLKYSNRLARLLVKLLPDEMGLEGSISTVPGGYKPHLAGKPGSVEMIVELLLLHASVLYDLYNETGRSITLALEPEPSCMLETISETVAFFEERLFNHQAIGRMASLCRLSMSEAESSIRRHLGVCFDTCHAAVEFEDANDAIARLHNAGIRIAKLQLSAGLRMPDASAHAVKKLSPFVEDVYLHQVIERSSAGMRRMIDLSEALIADANISNDLANREWRIHFHVPISSAQLGHFESTRPFLEEILAIHKNKPITSHLEIETYTWDVLPELYRKESLTSAIASELQWALEQLV